jgi:YD repeat-containing protein
MRPKHLLFLVLPVIYFSSCQKQVDWTIDPVIDTTTTPTIPTTPGGPSGDLLVKIVMVTGSETTTITYTYDASKRLISEHSLGTSAGMPLDSYRRFYRDDAGRIYKIAQLIKQTGLSMDTSFTYVHYDDPASKNFVYTVAEIGAFGFVTRDSSVFTYDGNGNLAMHKSYMSNDLLGSAPALTTRWEYTYSAGNLTGQKAYNDYANTGTLSLTATYKYTYDNKLNAMTLNGEAFLTGRTEGVSKNNVTKMELIDETAPANSITVTTALTYGSANKPATGKATLSPSGQVINYTFFYQ